MRAAALLVREARAEDALAVVDLLRANALEVAFEPAETLVAEQDGGVVATARLKRLADGSQELASVAVASALRGQGIGERIVRRALERADGPVHALALAPGFFARVGFARTPEAAPALREKAEGACASSGFVPMSWTPPDVTRARVRETYGRIALVRVAAPQDAAEASVGGCCGAAGGCCDAGDASRYSPEDLAALPSGAHLGLGTGNPVRAADLKPGETVVDLGSGAGVDVLLAARAVGPTGRAIGVDMTPEMLARARENARRGGFANAEFREGPIERLPVDDATADAIVSNCVVNLSPDKDATLAEAFRVLKRGGRFVVSDTLRESGGAPATAPSCDCTTGAMSEAEWRAALLRAGFVDVAVERTGAFSAGVGAALVRARKP